MGSGSSKKSTQKDYYADIAAVVCAGPVDRLCAIYVDGEKAWPKDSVPGWLGVILDISGLPVLPSSSPGLDSVGQPNPVQITVPDFGTCWFYWGTDTQTLDAGGEALLAAQGHPPYRRQAVAVLKKWKFGTGRTSAPNLEFVVQRQPRQSIVTGPAALLDADGQANPLACLAEILTDPVFGIGWPTSLFDLPSWQATADALLARSALTYISPACESASSARDRVESIRDYFDGWFRWSSSGKIVAGRFLHNEAPPVFTAANTITAADLIDEADIDAQGWGKTSNEAVVKFTNAASDYKDDSFTATSGYNRAITGEPRQITIDRPWVTRMSQAARQAAEALKLEAEPLFTGKLRVRGVKAAALPVGTVFRFVHDLLGIDLVARVTERELEPPPSETGSLSFRAERGLSTVRDIDGADAEAEPVPASAERIARFQFVSPPSALFGDNYRLLALCGRSQGLTAAVRLWFRRADSDQFQELGGQLGFAVPATLIAPYGYGVGDDNSEALRLAVANDVAAIDLETIATVQTEDQVEDGSMLLFIFSAANPSLFEILSLRSLRTVAGEWRAQVRRGQFGTAPRAWAANDLAWAIPRESLVAYTHAQFPALSRDEAVGTFRLQGATPFGASDLFDSALCPDIAHTFREAHPDDVTSFNIAGNRLTWLPIDDLYIAGYRIRYQPGTRQVWSDAVPLHEGLLAASPYEPASLPSGPVTLLVKAVDIAGAESKNAALIATDLGDPRVANIIETTDLRALLWPGTLTGGSVDGGNQLAANSLTLMWSANSAAPAWAGDSATLMWPAQTYAALSYEARVSVAAPLTGSTLTLAADIVGDPWSAYYRENSSALAWALDGETLVWGDDAAPAWDTPVFAPWPGALIVERETVFDFLITAGEGATQGRVNEFAVNVDAPDIAEDFSDIVTAAGGTRLPITKTYRVIKSVQLTIQTDGNGAVAARIDDKNAALGPLVKALNSAGAGVTGLLDASVRGY